MWRHLPSVPWWHFLLRGPSAEETSDEVDPFQKVSPIWTLSELVQVPWGEDVLGEIARATSAKDGLGSQGGGRPGEPSCTTTSSFLKDGQFVMGFRVLLRWLRMKYPKWSRNILKFKKTLMIFTQVMGTAGITSPIGSPPTRQRQPQRH